MYGCCKVKKTITVTGSVMIFTSMRYPVSIESNATRPLKRSGWETGRLSDLAVSKNNQRSFYGTGSSHNTHKYHFILATEYFFSSLFFQLPF